MVYIRYPASGFASNYKDPVDNSAALPITNNTVGDVRLTKDTGILYYFAEDLTWHMVQTNDIEGDLTVHGDLIVEGDSVELEVQTVLVEDNMMVLNSGEVGAGVTAGASGIRVDRGTQDDFLFTFDEVRDLFVVGKATDETAPSISSLQAVATREDIPTDQGITYYDSASKQLKTATGLTYFNNNIVGDINTDAKDFSGWVNNNNNILSTYDANTRTVTINAGQSYYIKNKKYTLSSPLVLQHPDVDANYYFYIDSVDGVFKVSTVAWNYYDIQCLYVVYRSSLTPKGLAFYEFHDLMAWGTHKALHKGVGTIRDSGGTISGYTLQDSSDTNNNFAVDSAVIRDEDIYFTTTAKADNTPWTVLYKNGANWEYIYNNAYSALISPTNYIYYNPITAGSGALTTASNGDFVNYYLFATLALDANVQYFLIPDQFIHNTLSAAQGSNIINLDLSGLPFEEMIAIQKITYRLGNSYASTGQYRIEQTDTIVGSKMSLVNVSGSSSPSIHNNLSGRSDDSCHPASSIDVDASTFSGMLTNSETTAQSALQKINDSINQALLTTASPTFAAITVPTITPAGVGLSVSTTGSTFGGNKYTLLLKDTNPLAANNGSGIIFGAIATGSTVSSDLGSIRINKDNSTDGHYGYSLQFYNSTSSGTLTKHMEISSSGAVTLGPAAFNLAAIPTTDVTVASWGYTGLPKLTLQQNNSTGVHNWVSAAGFTTIFKVDSTEQLTLGPTGAVTLGPAAGGVTHTLIGATTLLDGSAGSHDLYLRCLATGQANINLGTSASPSEGKILYSTNSHEMTFTANSIQSLVLSSTGAVTLGPAAGGVTHVVNGGIKWGASNSYTNERFIQPPVLSDDSVYNVGLLNGILTLIDISEGTTVTFSCRGGNNSTLVVTDPYAVASNADTDGKWCCFYNAVMSTYYLKNRRGGNRACSLKLMGS